jgi:release factor glutamine methyltransferase
MTLSDWTKRAISTWESAAEAGSACEVLDYRFEVDMILCGVLICHRADLYSNALNEIDGTSKIKADRWLDLRMQDYPLAYLTGTKFFMGESYIVSPDVLIPRPETEELSEIVFQDSDFRNYLESCRAGRLEKKGSDGDRLEDKFGPSISDWGAGSGCLGISLCKRIPDLQLLAIENSMGAAKICLKNAEKLMVKSRFQLVTEDIRKGAEFLNHPFRGCSVVMNPPYISKTDGKTKVQIGVDKFEPHSALYSDDSGLAHIKLWLELALAWVRPGAPIFCEFGESQEVDILNYLNSLQMPIKTKFIKDFSGKIRFLKAMKRP